MPLLEPLEDFLGGSSECAKGHFRRGCGCSPHLLYSWGPWGPGLTPALETYEKRAGLVNALAAKQRGLLVFPDWPTLPEFVQTKNVPRSGYGPLQGRASRGSILAPFNRDCSNV